MHGADGCPWVITLLPVHCLDLNPVLTCLVQISHGNTARHALEHGDDVLAKICGTIASDEGRHEQAYQRVSNRPCTRWYGCLQAAMSCFAWVLNRVRKCCQAA
jgi:hypothetical protein